MGGADCAWTGDLSAGWLLRSCRARGRAFVNTCCFLSQPRAQLPGLPDDHHPAPRSPPVVADGMPSYTAAREVVLVELAAGAVQHALTTRVALQQIAPQAKLTVLQAEWIPGAEPETP